MIGCRRDARQERGLLTQGPVRPVSVVMGDVLGQDAFEVATTEDQRSVEALSADGADGAFGEGVGSGSSDGVRMMRTHSALKTSSKLEVNLASRSRTRNRTGSTQSSSAMVRFLACWTTQEQVG